MDPLEPPAIDRGRPQPASSGVLIKTYIQHAEARRTASRFNTGKRAGDVDSELDGDARLEREEEDAPTDVDAVAGLFLSKQLRRVPGALGNAQAASVHRRKLVADGGGTLAPRPPLTILGGARGRHNLAAKLDTIARTSPWMRRRVVFGDDKDLRGAMRTGAQSRAVGGGNNAGGQSGAGGSKLSPGDQGQQSDAHRDAEMEKRVMAAFGRIVRLWRERKKQSEQVALNIVRGQGGSAPNGGASGTSNARFAPKLQRELDAQSSNVVSILSRRMIREVPALKFFDDSDEGDNMLGTLPPPSSTTRANTVPATGRPASKPSEAISHTRYRVSEPPRGVCYTRDELGCRRIKTQSSAQRAGPSASSSSKEMGATQIFTPPSKLEGISMEAAMGKSLRRKMARRVKTKRLAIIRIGDNFEKSQREMALKLNAKLALHQAESDKMFETRLAVLFSDAAAAPPYLAHRELALARARVRKAALIEKCQTLFAFGAMLRRIENASEMSGVDLSPSELHFLEMFRCIVENDQALTPLLAEGMRRHFPASQMECSPVIPELFDILDQHVVGGQVTIEDAWTSPAPPSPIL